MARSSTSESEFLKSIQRDLDSFEKSSGTKIDIEPVAKKRKPTKKIKVKRSISKKIKKSTVNSKPKRHKSTKIPKKVKAKIENPKIPKAKNISSLKLRSEFDIAMDFATKVYQKFNKIIKSVILFGSTMKKTNVPGSDIDIIILIDDASIKWDQELISWYREELEKVITTNPYKNELHINTIKLTTWWDDLMRGDPIIMSILRDGQPLIDMAGFFEPLKYLLVTGKIRATPESIYSLLQRAPQHLSRSRLSELNAIEGLYWGMVDSAQAALIAVGASPSSPENIAVDLKINFVNSGKLNGKYVSWYRDLLNLHKDIIHGKISNLKGAEIDTWQQKAEEFTNTMIKLVDETISGN